ncbi:MAG: ABC transporter permease [Deltaproteobacteria bacterium]|nr:ABC transporter permease [Deltaproteobacteria bacterium]
MTSDESSAARRRRRVWRAMKRNKTTLVGLVLTAAILLVALFAPWLVPYDPVQQDLLKGDLPPGGEHVLGTDSFGRDVLSRVIMGARVSLGIALSAVGMALIFGSTLGVVAGYKGGPIDTVTVRLTDLLMTFPTTILGLMVLAVLGSGMVNLSIAIAIAITPRFARIARGSAIAMRERDFIQGARALGMSDTRIICKHVLPNISNEVLVVASLWTATAILQEANLSFIGLGVKPPTPSWGSMIRDGVNQLLNQPWLSIAPGAAIFAVVLAFNMIGDGLRDILDPRTMD